MRKALIGIMIGLILITIPLQAQEFQLPNFDKAVNSVRIGDWFYYYIEKKTWNPYLNRTTIQEYTDNITVLDRNPELIKLYYDRKFLSFDMAVNFTRIFMRDNISMIYPLFLPRDGSYYERDERVEGNATYSFDFISREVIKNTIVINFVYYYNLTLHFFDDNSTSVWIKEYNATAVLNAFYPTIAQNLTLEGAILEHIFYTNDTLRQLSESFKEEHQFIELRESSIEFKLSEGSSITMSIWGPLIFVVVITAVISCFYLYRRYRFAKYVEE